MNFVLQAAQGPSRYKWRGSRHLWYSSHSYSLPTLKIAKTKNRSVALLFLSHCVVSCVDDMRRRHSHLYIGVEWSVLGNIPQDPTCNRLGRATRRGHVEGGGGAYMQGCRRTLGVVAPRCCLPAIAFSMAVACWS